MFAASPSLLDVSSFEKLVSARRVDQKNFAPLTLECIYIGYLPRNENLFGIGSVHDLG